MPLPHLPFAVALAVLCGLAPGQTPDEQFFEQRIRPLLVAKCYGCHSAEKGKSKGGLSLDSREGWSRGGDSGPAIVPGDAEASRLIRAVRYGDETLRMPPPGRLSDREVADLEAWVKMGAPDPRGPGLPGAAPPPAAPIPAAPVIDWDRARKHWAFQPPRDAPPPEVRDTAWCANEVDRFVLSRLEAEGLRPAPEADRRTLLRRATFDLTGLPPTEEEIAAFLADDTPDAFARVVDRLLASPHYGERFGRHWLDLARYADSNGLDENLALGHAWRYRDYVVRSFNDDKPYDVFLTEQLAGDLLPEAPDPAKTFDAWTATGLLVMGPKMLAEQDKDKLVLDVVDEQIDVASRTFLGLTVACARCHDHKFDPIPTRDYYALAGIFKSTSTMAHLEHVSRWRERELAPAAKVAEAAAWKKAFDEAEASVKTLAENARLEAMTGVRRQIGAYLLAGSAAAAAAIFVEAEEMSRGNLAIDTDHWGTPETPVARSGNPSVHPQFVEYDLTVAGGGRHRIEVRFAGKESRPMRVLLNGEVVVAEALAETTKDWFPKDQRWFPVAAVELRPGRNVLRLERDGPVPHLDKILVTRDAGGAAWPASVPEASGLDPDVVRTWADRLVVAARRGDPVLGLWVEAVRATSAQPRAPERSPDAGAGTLPAPTGVAGLSAVYAENHGRAGGTPALPPAALEAAWDRLRADRDAGRLKLVPPVAALLDAPAPSSPAELAARHQAVFAVAALTFERKRSATPPDKEARLDDPDLDAVARALHGPGGLLDIAPDAPEAAYPPEFREKLAAGRAAVEELKRRRPPDFDRALAVVDGKPVELPVHIRGDHLNLGKDAVPRGFLEVTAAAVPPPEVPKEASGRLELARWLTDPGHPLTARVIVNRLWHAHFGHGLVRTPSNFGLRGEAPSHPELLDWLARELIRRNWSLKSLHRTILLSRTWRQGATGDATARERDPENRLLARQNRRRLEAEAVRDSILAVSGALDRRIGGSLLGVGNGDYVTNDQSADKARYSAPRRTLYLPVIRNSMADLFTLFDYPDSSTHLEQRPASTVPGQALWFMNSPFVLEESARFARRVLDAAPGDGERLEKAYALAYGRPPSAEDVARAERWLSRSSPVAPNGDSPAGTPVAGAATPTPTAGSERDLESWTGLCQVLLAANEFIHVE